MPKRRSRVGRRTLLVGGIGALAAVGGATAWGFERFVIDHVEVSNASQLTASKATVATPARNGTRTATSYKSKTASVSISKTERGSGDNKITFFTAKVSVSHATILRSAFADDKFGRNITADTGKIASDVKAVLAVNGDYYGMRQDGIVVRNGVAYRDKGKREGLALFADGSVRLFDETKTTAAKLVNAGVWNTFSFGPGLVENGRIRSGIDKFEISDFGPRQAGAFGSIQGNQPRTGIGIVDNNRFVLIVVSGRGADGSRGASMTEFAQIFLDAGANTAYNLDGGGSSTMVFGEKLVNTPATHGGNQRGTSDILYVAG